MGTLLGSFLAVVLFLGASGLKLDREYQRGVIFRLGRINGVRGPGMYWILPVLDQKTQIDIRTKTVTIEPQETVTADSVTIKVNAVLYYRILDASKAINKVENYELAVYQTALTSLRNVVGQNILDDVLQNRDKINIKVQEIVDEITEPWGIVIERVEMKDVEIPWLCNGQWRKKRKQIGKTCVLIKAAAEQEASIKLSEASKRLWKTPLL
jgi:regulator of protease activity HflC (stomatin/prohibitin superfamily)